jgi:hypothetical protein
MLRLRSRQMAAPSSGMALATASAMRSMCGFSSRKVVESFQRSDSRGLEMVSRPLVPNTATASLSALSVERCTSSSERCWLCISSCAVMSSNT